MKIQMKHFIDIVYPVTLRNFLLTHEDFVDPEYVLRDSVTLLQVEKDTVIFIEAKEGMPPAFSLRYAFATIGQMVTGEYIITMSLSTFLRLAEKLENPGTKAVFIHNIARYGGSLVTNILEHTGRVVAWNEPRMLDFIGKQVNHAWNRKISKQVFRAAVKMLCKPYGGLDLPPLKYAIKVCPIMGSYWRLFHEAVPEATNIFVYIGT